MDRRNAMKAALAAIMLPLLSAGDDTPYRWWFKSVGPNDCRQWKLVDFGDIEAGDAVCCLESLDDMIQHGTGWSPAYWVIEGPSGGVPGQRKIIAKEV